MKNSLKAKTYISLILISYILFFCTSCSPAQQATNDTIFFKEFKNKNLEILCTDINKTYEDIFTSFLSESINFETDFTFSANDSTFDIKDIPLPAYGSLMCGQSLESTSISLFNIPDFFQKADPYLMPEISFKSEYDTFFRFSGIFADTPFLMILNQDSHRTHTINGEVIEDERLGNSLTDITLMFHLSENEIEGFSQWFNIREKLKSQLGAPRDYPIDTENIYDDISLEDFLSSSHDTVLVSWGYSDVTLTLFLSLSDEGNPQELKIFIREYS